MKGKDSSWGSVSVYIYSKHKTAGLAILITEKTEFKRSSVNCHKQGHFIMIKGSIHQEFLLSLNINVAS